MKLVADANILFSLINPSSFTSKMVENNQIELYSPEYAIDELKKYEKEIIQKTKISSFQEGVKRLRNLVVFVKIEDFEHELRAVQNLISDEKDLIYLALAKNMKISIWSDDKHLKEQGIIPAFTTEEMIDALPLD
ncbi:MAG: PIN domain-containing protein [Nanoarchaeota archaeon]